METESVQVMFEQHHWVATACIGGAVLVADSMKDRISADLARQLRQLYARQLTPAGNLRIAMVPVQKQKDASSCGVYAAAFAFDLASGAVTSSETSLDSDYGSPRDMRLHLARCFEGNVLIPFAKTTVKKRGRKAQPRMVTI